MENEIRRNRFPFMKLRFGIIAGIFLAIFTLYPQIKMVSSRGGEWNGHYAYNDIDEVAYASYLRALIDGRPRKNDPYSGRDDSPESPQPESLFSIQFAAPYTIAIPARIFGIGAPWAMTISGAAAGFLAALFVFVLLARLTGDNWYAMAASIAVFAGGALAAGEGAISEILFDGFSYPYFPGFRRYIPAMAFPAFFALVFLLWKLVSREGGKRQTAAVRGPEQSVENSSFSRLPLVLPFSLAILCFAYTVYSYFYVWTTATALLACTVLLWTITRPEGFQRDLKNFAGLGAGFAAVLLPYFYLLSQRAETIDDVQLLVETRLPDLARMPEYIGLFVLAVLAWAGVAGIINVRDRAVLFAASLALVPLVIFNQQIITGRSLQPIHYQVFIGNYVAMLALVFAAGVFWRDAAVRKIRFLRPTAAGFALTAIIWGFVECHYTVRVLDEANAARDSALPVAEALEEIARSDKNPHQRTVLAFDGIQADDLPSVAPQNVLWSRHQHIFAGLTWPESKERYYQYLYYSNIDADGLDYLLKNDFVSMIALFGWGRHSDRLNSKYKPLTYGEIAEEVRRYAEYIDGFDRQRAANPLISYVVVAADRQSALHTVSKWYELDEGRRIGDYILFEAALLDETNSYFPNRP